MSPLSDLLSQRCVRFRAFGTATQSRTKPQQSRGRRLACAHLPADDARARARSSRCKQVKKSIISGVRSPYREDWSDEGVVQGNQSQDAVAAETRRACVFRLLAMGSLCTFEAKAKAAEVSDEEICAAVRSAFYKTAEKSKAPVLLRLVFHDSGAFSMRSGDGGANASVRFELKRPENRGLNRGWKVIEQTMESLRGTSAEGRVGYADLVALGGAYAVAVTGGPDIPIRIGRQDASEVDPEGRLPLETATAAELLQNFADKGFTPSELVALSGAHTLGNKGFGDPLTFDNQYFKAMLQRPWEDKSNSMASMIGLPSDHVLPDAVPCRPAIQRYADSQSAFFADFAAAFQKLTSLGTNWA